MERMLFCSHMDVEDTCAAPSFGDFPHSLATRLPCSFTFSAPRTGSTLNMNVDGREVIIVKGPQRLLSPLGKGLVVTKRTNLGMFWCKVI